MFLQFSYLRDQKEHPAPAAAGRQKKQPKNETEENEVLSTNKRKLEIFKCNPQLTADNESKSVPASVSGSPSPLHHTQIQAKVRKSYSPIIKGQSNNVIYLQHNLQ